MIRYFKNTVYITTFIGLFMLPFSISAQQEMTKEERIKALEKLKLDDEKLETNTLGMISKNVPLEIENFDVFRREAEHADANAAALEQDPRLRAGVT